MCPEKLSELGGLSELSVPELTDLYCISLAECIPLSLLAPLAGIAKNLCNHELFWGFVVNLWF